MENGPDRVVDGPLSPFSILHFPFSQCEQQLRFRGEVDLNPHGNVQRLLIARMLLDTVFLVANSSLATTHCRFIVAVPASWQHSTQRENAAFDLEGFHRVRAREHSR